MFVQNTSNSIIQGLVCTLLDTPSSASMIHLYLPPHRLCMLDSPKIILDQRICIHKDVHNWYNCFNHLLHCCMGLLRMINESNLNTVTADTYSNQVTLL